MFKSQVLKRFRKAFGPWVMAAPPRRRERPTFKPRLEGLENRIAPAQVAVTNLNPNGLGSLDAAITAVNGSKDANNQIIFQGAGASGTIALTAALPAITNNVDILGPGASQLTVARDSTKPAFGLFSTTAGTTVSITGLTLVNGASNRGGAIDNSGTCTLTNDSINENTSSASGGGIYNEKSGTLTLNGVSMWYNTAFSNGGAIYNDGGKVNINTNSQIFVNLGSSGGGIFNGNNGSLTISQSQIYSNQATGNGDAGGGIESSGTLIWNGGLLQGNTATTGNGGGLGVFGGTANLTNVLITKGNSANAGNGGGFWASKGSVTLNTCTLSGNQAMVGAGGAYVKAAATVTVNGGTITDPIVGV